MSIPSYHDYHAAESNVTERERERKGLRVRGFQQRESHHKFVWANAKCMSRADREKVQ